MSFAADRIAVRVLRIPRSGLVFDNHLDGVPLVLVEQIIDRSVRTGSRTAASAPPFREDGHDEHRNKDKKDYGPDEAGRVFRAHSENLMTDAFPHVEVAP
jgi:hypothetical protein